jgi:hypothetical protein
VVLIPQSLLNDVKRVPIDRPAVLLMRHSARHPIIDPAQPFIAALTEEGVRLAEEFGVVLGGRYSPGKLMSAPVGRCIDTAAAIARGAGWAGAVQSEEYLSHPFIEPAWDQLCRGEVNGVLPRQVRATLDLLLKSERSAPGLDVAVTHDTVLGAVAGCLLKTPVMGEHWPEFLEGLFAWRDGEQVRVLWRGAEWHFGTDYR